MPEKNSCRRKLSFQTLENREVLSANLPLGTNLVENGDFENLEGNIALDWTGTPQAETFDFAANVDRGNVAFVADGNEITQTIDVINGQQYVLTFDFRLAHASTEGQVDVNGSKLINASRRWQTSATVLQAESDTLEIRLLANAGDIFIDCVRLTPVEDLNLTNGSFEDLPNDEDNMFSSRDLAGWNSVGDPSDPNMNLDREQSSDGSSSLKVDGNSDRVDRIFQQVAAETGQSILITFDAMGSGSATGLENQLRVRWNDQFAGAFDTTTEWQSFGFIVDADSDLSRLLFREVGSPSNPGDGEGPYIDNVKAFRIVPGSESLTIDEPDPQVKEFTEDDGPVSLLSDGFSVSNTVDGFLSGAVVRIQNLLDGAGNEFLDVNAGDTGINVDFDPATGRLRLSGRASLEDYETVLKTLTYENFSDNPDTTAREIRITVDYGQAVSDPVTVDVNVNAVNDRPTIRPIDDQSVTVLTSFFTQVDASDAEDPENLNYSISATGTAISGDDPGPTISESGLIQWVPNQSGDAEFTVTVEDPEGAFIRRTFNVSAVLDAEVPSNFSPFSGARQLSNVQPLLRNDIYEQAPSMNLNLDNEYRAIIVTDKGEIEILLYDNDTPITVNNFVNLARDGYYDGLTFQRVQSLINSATDGFIAQGGDPLGTSGGGPGYNFADENLAGSIFDRPLAAMANRGVNTSTNGGQFFLTFDDRVTHLNGNHTVFGEITRGLDVLNAVTKRVPGSSIPAEIIRRINIVEIEP